ncbi:IclR family transcriptional regulator [Prauserella muralis]|uniref:IclR family transcriptional regulator n=1 Tax=Prauserella muralis TaxID=588067 RepID=A0A2V4AKH8_9PSEU|nr:IclR family transcriptional regulator [Prauserella muralis]PXY20798.1 IclR family transcriptional regulator [Prauserella muralis]TWE29823.1 IclR family transcriptional regulator [Prauserella muralis]
MRESPARRLLRVFEAFSAHHPELNLTEISQRCGLPISTTHRLVGELLRWGALERGPGGYRIGLRLWEVATLAPRGLGLRDVAWPFLEDLYLATRENVLLAVRDGTEIVFVERLSGPGAITVLTTLGRRRSLHASSAGLTLLAHAPCEVQEAVLASPLRRYTAKTIADPVRLRRTLAEIRHNGFAVCDGHMKLDAVSVAAPIEDGSGAVTAALSVVVSASTDHRRLVPAVVTAARGVSRALGAPHGKRGRRQGLAG